MVEAIYAWRFSRGILLMNRYYVVTNFSNRRPVFLGGR